MVSDRSEALFIDGLVNAFGYLHVERIPFANYQFDSGIEAAKEFLQNNYPEVYGTIDTLFIREPISGEYSGIINGFQRIFGKQLAIETPFFDSIVILNRSHEKPDKVYLDSARVFSEAIGIGYKDYAG